LHKHHPIIRVGANLIQFVYRSHLRLATEATRNRNAFSPFFARVFRVVVKKIVSQEGVIKKEIKLNCVLIILTLPYLSTGQCPIQDPTPLITQKQISNFCQFDGFWSRGWVAYPTPPGGGIGQTTLSGPLPESKGFDFSK